MEVKKPPEEGLKKHGLAIQINGKDYAIEDSEPTGRQILSEGAFEPNDEHLLVQFMPHHTCHIGLDEVVKLEKDQIACFQAHPGDVLYPFTLNTHGCVWGDSKISESTLRTIGGINDEYVLVLERSDEADKELGPNDFVHLNEAGTERIRSIKKNVTVYLDGNSKVIARGVYTLEQLLQVLGVPEGYLLNIVESDGTLRALVVGAVVKVKEGMKFISQVPCGVAS